MDSLCETLRMLDNCGVGLSTPCLSSAPCLKSHALNKSPSTAPPGLFLQADPQIMQMPWSSLISAFTNLPVEARDSDLFRPQLSINMIFPGGLSWTRTPCHHNTSCAPSRISFPTMETKLSPKRCDALSKDVPCPHGAGRAVITDAYLPTPQTHAF